MAVPQNSWRSSTLMPVRRPSSQSMDSSVKRAVLRSDATRPGSSFLVKHISSEPDSESRSKISYKWRTVLREERFFVPTLRVQVLRSWSSTSRLNLIQNLDLRSVTSGEPSFVKNGSSFRRFASRFFVLGQAHLV